MTKPEKYWVRSGTKVICFKIFWKYLSICLEVNPIVCIHSFILIVLKIIFIFALRYPLFFFELSLLNFVETPVANALKDLPGSYHDPETTKMYLNYFPMYIYLDFYIYISKQEKEKKIALDDTITIKIPKRNFLDDCIEIFVGCIKMVLMNSGTGIKLLVPSNMAC